MLEIYFKLLVIFSEQLEDVIPLSAGFHLLLLTKHLSNQSSIYHVGESNCFRVLLLGFILVVL